MRTICRKSFAIGLLVAFLVVSTGKAVPVSAVGTTAAIAGTAFILTGAVYMSYIALTQGELVLPAAEELHNWLGSIGKKVSQYPSGAEAYQDIYQKIAREPFTGVIDDVWTWTQDRLKSFANDFSDTRIIENICGYVDYVDTTYATTNGFNYPTLRHAPLITNNGVTFSQLASQGYNISPYGDITVVYNLTQSFTSYDVCSLTGTWRNIRKTNGKYYAQHLVNGTWVDDFPQFYLGYKAALNGNTEQLSPQTDSLFYYLSSPQQTYIYGVLDGLTYPPFVNLVIHDEATDTDLPMVIPDAEVFHAPQWVDPDNDNRPIIPWIPIPNLPVNVTPPTGYVNPQWGFNLQDLLDKLEELAGTLMDIGAIEALINGFAGLHGDDYYLYYTEGDTNYYIYYQPTNYDNDTEYVTYNIDVSDTEEHLPVDLNTIQIYSNNRYVEQFKKSAIAGGSIIRDLVVFWYDVDPEIVYCLFGACIIVLIGAFIGKWGHS